MDTTSHIYLTFGDSESASPAWPNVKSFYTQTCSAEGISNPASLNFAPIHPFPSPRIAPAIPPFGSPDVLSPLPQQSVGLTSRWWSLAVGLIIRHFTLIHEQSRLRRQVSVSPPGPRVPGTQCTLCDILGSDDCKKKNLSLIYFYYGKFQLTKKV